MSTTPRPPSRAPTSPRGAPGEPLFVDACVRDLQGRPVAGAEVDVWQADDEGLYDVQRPELGEQRRARGVLRSDAEGRVRFRSIVPTPYPVPTDGPVGQHAAGQRPPPVAAGAPALLIRAEGYETLITHIFRDADPYLDSDVVFGVRNSLMVQMPENPGKPGRHLLRHDFVLNPTH